ncbi:hypothetical protein BLNAU_2328 [Blattamonas nauphoetae]|uniref:Rho-GAP domain-containing protein n=1 Tax=Blattamonas nauphoetae TaxID=2049346 RepID=A0ABQ9YFT5_9EUKA|nr:hypothetical protein BLNAU_2328 [Blattamonas nauphoetae]
MPGEFSFFSQSRQLVSQLGLVNTASAADTSIHFLQFFLTTFRHKTMSEDEGVGDNRGRKKDDGTEYHRPDDDRRAEQCLADVSSFTSQSRSSNAPLNGLQSFCSLQQSPSQVAIVKKIINHSLSIFKQSAQDYSRSPTASYKAESKADKADTLFVMIMVQSGVEARLYPHSKGSIPPPLVHVVTGQAGKFSTMLASCGALAHSSDFLKQLLHLSETIFTVSELLIVFSQSSHTTNMMLKAVPSVNGLVTRQTQVPQTPRTVMPFLDILVDFVVECWHRSLLQDITFLAQMQDRSSLELKINRRGRLPRATLRVLDSINSFPTKASNLAWLKSQLRRASNTLGYPRPSGFVAHQHHNLVNGGSVQLAPSHGSSRFVQAADNEPRSSHPLSDAGLPLCPAIILHVWNWIDDTNPFRIESEGRTSVSGSKLILEGLTTEQKSLTIFLTKSNLAERMEEIVVVFIEEMRLVGNLSQIIKELNESVISLKRLNCLQRIHEMLKTISNQVSPPPNSISSVLLFLHLERLQPPDGRHYPTVSDVADRIGPL